MPFARGFDRGGKAIEKAGQMIQELLVRQPPRPQVLPAQDRPPVEDLFAMSDEQHASKRKSIRVQR